MTDTEIIDLLWAKVEPVLYLTRRELEASLEGWTLEPIHRDGTFLGVVLTKGPELHFMTVGQPVPVKVVRDLLRRGLAEHGYVTTRTPKGAERQHRFNRVVGFRAVDEDEYDIHYRLDAIGRHACP